MSKCIDLDEWENQQHKMYLKKEIVTLEKDNEALRKENSDLKNGVILYKVVSAIFVLLSVILML